MIRRPLQFETIVGTYTWPRYQLEYDATQPLILAMIDLPGADYQFDQLGDAPAVKGVGTQVVRFLLVGEPAAIEAEMDEMRRVCYLGARGSFVLADDAGVQRKCTARITAMPQITLGTRDRQRAPVILNFVQLSDFYSVDVAVGTDPITTDPQYVYIETPGNASVFRGKLRVAGPFDGLKLTNLAITVPGSTLSYVFQTDRVAAAGEWLEIDVGQNTVRFSDDFGGTWTDDSDNVVLQDGQVGLFAFAGGVNLINVENAVGGEVHYEVPGGWL